MESFAPSLMDRLRSDGAPDNRLVSALAGPPPPPPADLPPQYTLKNYDYLWDHNYLPAMSHDVEWRLLAQFVRESYLGGPVSHTGVGWANTAAGKQLALRMPPNDPLARVYLANWPAKEKLRPRQRRVVEWAMRLPAQQPLHQDWVDAIKHLPEDRLMDWLYRPDFSYAWLRPADHLVMLAHLVNNDEMFGGAHDPEKCMVISLLRSELFPDTASLEPLNIAALVAVRAPLTRVQSVLLMKSRYATRRVAQGFPYTQESYPYLPRPENQMPAYRAAYLHAAGKDIPTPGW